MYLILVDLAPTPRYPLAQVYPTVEAAVEAAKRALDVELGSPDTEVDLYADFDTEETPTVATVYGDSGDEQGICYIYALQTA